MLRAHRSATQFVLGPYRFDGGARVLFLEDRVVPLPSKTLELLLLLLAHPGQVVSKEEILDRIWPGSSVEEGNVAVHISALRKALATGIPGTRIIETIPTKGYLFALPVRTESLPDETVIRLAETAVLAFSPVAPAPAVPAGHASARSRIAILSAVTLVVIALLVTAGRQFGTRDPDLHFVEITNSGMAGFGAISPDSSHIAWLDSNEAGQSFWLQDLSTGARRQFLPPVSHCPPVFAADGKSIFTCIGSPGSPRPNIVRVPLNTGMVAGIPQIVALDALGPQGVAPNGRQISFLTDEERETHLWVVDVDGRNRRIVKTLQRPTRFAGTAWSPDSSMLAYWYRPSTNAGQHLAIAAVNVADGSDVPLGRAEWTFADLVGRMKWAPDGKALIATGIDTTTGRRQIYQVSFPDLSARRITNDLSDYFEISLSADGDSLVSTKQDAVSRIWIAPQGDSSRALQITPGSALYSSPAWTRDGRILSVSRGIHLLDPVKKTDIQLPGIGPEDESADLSPDARTLVYVAHRGTSREIIVRPVAGGPAASPEVSITTKDAPAHPRFSPDGQWVVFDAFDGPEQTIWRVSPAGGPPLRLTPASHVYAPVYSPDGKWIAVFGAPYPLGSPFAIKIIPATGGAPVQTFNVTATVTSVEWTSDSTTVTWIETQNGVSNVHGRALDGSPAHQLTRFQSGEIFGFDWSASGDLVVARGGKSRDVVLIRNYRRR